MKKTIGIFSLIMIGIVAYMYFLEHLSPKQTHKTKLMVMAYYVKYSETDDSSYQSLKRYGNDLNDVVFSTYQLNEKADIQTQGKEAPEGMKLSKQQHKTTYALYSNAGFNSNTAHVLLTHSSLREKAIKGILNTTVKQGYQGINLDFEGVDAKDRKVFNQFIKEITDHAHEKRLKLIVSVPAKSTDCPTCSWEGAYDYAYIGKQADYIQIMTYDEHGTWGEPGAIASYSWVKDALDYTLTIVSPAKIIMGVAAYGYDWDINNPKKNKAVEGSLYFNAKAKWDEEAKSPYLTYTDAKHDKHVVWFENKKSLSYKIKLAKEDGIGGMAVWRLGQENQSFWQSIKTLE